MVGTTRQPGFNVPLNGYRGLCALFVFIYHVANAKVVALDDFGPAASFALSSFRYGVEMFFMISGFVIPFSLARRPKLVAFLRDRFIRIYSAWLPILTIATAVCFTLGMAMFSGVTAAHALWMYAENVFLLPPLLPGMLIVAGSWSLTYEWVFYLAVATLRFGVRPRKSRVLTLAWILAAVLFAALFPRALFFLPGVLVFKYRAWFGRHKGWLQVPWVSLIVFLLAWRATGADQAELTETLFDYARDGRLLFAAVALVAAIHMFASVSLHATTSFWFLESRAFQFLGNISYSFYLWQSLVISLIKRIVAVAIGAHVTPAIELAVVAVFAFAAVVPLSWASWSFLEVRLAKWMRAVLAPAPEHPDQFEQPEELPKPRAMSTAT